MTSPPPPRSATPDMSTRLDIATALNPLTAHGEDTTIRVRLPPVTAATGDKRLEHEAEAVAPAVTHWATATSSATPSADLSPESPSRLNKELSSWRASTSVSSHASTTPPTSPSSPRTVLANSPPIFNDPRSVETWCSEDGARRLAEIRENNMLEEAHQVDVLFENKQYKQCRSLCWDIIAGNPPGEAIQARAHQYLASEYVTKGATRRLGHAQQAVELWNKVIDRTGNSKYPIEKAAVGRELAMTLIQLAETQVELERQRNVPTIR